MGYEIGVGVSDSTFLAFVLESRLEQKDSGNTPVVL